MRADSHHVLENLAESCRDESRPRQCPEENWEDAELKISENGKNNNNVCELFYDTRSGDGTDENTLECHSCGDSDGTGKKIRSNNHDFASIGDSLEKVDPVFFMDKNVTACDLPEVVVCYKENTYHVVKDICVDEGVPIQEKFLFGEKDSVKCSSNSHQCGSEALMKADKVNVNPTETKSLEDIKSKVDDLKAYQDLEQSSREYFSDAETSSNCKQEDLTVTDSPMHALNLSEISEPDDNLKDQVATSKSVLKESLTLGDILSREGEQNSLINSNNIDRLEEETSPQLQDEESRSLETTPFETELEETEESKKAELNLSSVSTTISQEPNKTGKDPENPETETKQQNNLVGDSYEDDKLFASSFGETSFCAAEPVSGHITYSGPIAFSGSLSVRSDASTTSGRSFAFPILQSEWNSSPVRMAKADKRRQKGWRNSLLCCRFS